MAEGPLPAPPAASSWQHLLPFPSHARRVEALLGPGAVRVRRSPQIVFGAPRDLSREVPAPRQSPVGLGDPARLKGPALEPARSHEQLAPGDVFVHGRRVRGDDRQAARERLKDQESDPLDLRGLDRHMGIRIELCWIREVAETDLDPWIGPGQLDLPLPADDEAQRGHRYAPEVDGRVASPLAIKGIHERAVVDEDARRPRHAAGGKASERQRPRSDSNGIAEAVAADHIEGDARAAHEFVAVAPQRVPAHEPFPVRHAQRAHPEVAADWKEPRVPVGSLEDENPLEAAQQLAELLQPAAWVESTLARA